MGKATNLNQKVVLWASGHRGKKVGAGECWDLGEAALRHAGAMTSNDLGEVGDDTDYVWGDEVAIKDVIPGDILQFRDHVATITTEAVYTFADGTTETMTEEQTATREHHTAIANGTLQSDGSLRTLEQHTEPKGDVVQNLKIYTRSVAPHVIVGHERRKYPHGTRTENVKVTKTAKVTVTGTIWAYRPKAK
jgi:hypothetical protein